MEQEIVIHSGRKDFVLLERILEVGPSHIVGRASFQNAPPYLGLESLAQTGAYHVRCLTAFAKHAFLLKIADCALPEGRLEGTYRIRGTLAGRSESGFSYHLRFERGDAAVMEGVFLFAAVDYSERFSRDLLEGHYRKVYACLQRDSETAS